MILLIVMAAAAVGLSFLGRTLVASYIQDYYSNVGSMVAEIIAASAEEYGSDFVAFGRDRMARIIQQLCREYDIYDVYVEVSKPPYETSVEEVYINKDVIYVVEEDEREEREFEVSDYERRILHGEVNSTYSIYSRDGFSIITYMRGIYDGTGKVIAVAGVDFLDSMMVQEISQDVRAVVWVIIGVMALIMITLMLLIHFLVINPVKNVSEHMRGFITGDRLNSVKIPVKGKNEIAQMAADFNTMADDITAYVKTVGSMDAAAHIQKGMLPPAHFENSEVEIYALMQPARHVGGDFYDYFELPDGRKCFVIADVSGKGINAAMFMAGAINAIRYNAKLFAEPSEILRSANNDLAARNPEQLFVTAFAAVFDPAEKTLIYSNAGHNPPYFIRGGRYEELRGASGLLLGLFEDEEYENETIEIRPGDRLFMYTDGLNEAESPEKTFFGMERIEECLTEGCNITEVILEKLKAFTGEAEQHDDITMLSVTFKEHHTLELEAKLSEIGSLKRLIMENPNIPQELRKKIYLACEELFVNICRYAYDKDKPGKVWIDLKMRKDHMELTFTDEGMAYDPLQDVISPEEYDIDTRIGGLGKLLVFTIMDREEYEYKDGKNILRLRKDFK